ncbi:MAG: hypothetical protein ACFFDN_06930 [Candidatus Hodarchaeota archaeon]
MEEKELIELQKKVYDFMPLLFEIVKAQYKRELSFLAPTSHSGKKKAIRYMLAYNVDYLKKHLIWINYDKKPLNMYQSVATLKDIPVFSYNLKKRLDDEKYKEFNENYEQHITGYDLFFDLDGKEHPEVLHEEALFINDLLRNFKIPYYVLSSSLRGFHFRIPAEYMPGINLQKLNSVIKNIKNIYGLQCLDEAIIDYKRLCKTPYSFVGYSAKELDGSICLPLSDAQLTVFNKEMIKAGNILKQVMIKNRGLLIRTHNLSKEELKSNVANFINQFTE